MSVAMLCEELSKAGVFIEVFTTTANGPEELPVNIGQPVKIDGITVTYFKRLTKDHTHFSPALLTALWKRAGEFDVIHIHAWWNLVSIFSCMVALVRRVPVVLSPRGTLSPYSFVNKNIRQKQLIHKLLGKRILKKCHFHVTSLRENLASTQLVQPISITTIPNFVKLPNLAPVAATVKETSLKLLFLSRIEEKKGLDILLQALTTLTVPYRLTIAGDGSKDYIDQLKGYAINNHIDDKITWAGFYGDNKFELIRQHHLLILPSHDENFGNVVIESLSAGTAVLISEHVGLADYVIANHFGWVCQTNPGSVANSIVNICTNHQDDLVKIREAAPCIVRKDFTGEQLAQQYISMYNKILSHE